MDTVKIFSSDVITSVYNYLMLFEPKEMGCHYKQKTLYVRAPCLYYIKPSHICKYYYNKKPAW